MRYTPGMWLTAAGLVVWYTLTDDVGPYPFLLPLLVGCAVSAILDGLFGVRPFWVQEEQIPNKKFYSKK